MILLRDPHGKAASARLSTDHAASSYGIPVLVLRDGTALGPGDVALQGYQIMSATQREQTALEAAGFRFGWPTGGGVDRKIPGDTGQGGYSYHPLDVGFDVRVQDMTIQVPGDARAVAYEQDGARRVATGDRATIVAALEAAGYVVAAAGGAR